MKGKKGQLGMDTAKAFLIGLMTLLIVGVATLIVLNSLGNTSVAGPDVYIVNVANETGAWINATKYVLGGASTSGFTTFTITELYNATDNSTIGMGNITLASDGFTVSATGDDYDGDDSVMLSYTYNYERQSNTQSVIYNGTGAVSSFFSNTSVWLGLLGIVVIILIIAVVVAVVNRFGGGRIGI